MAKLSMVGDLLMLQLVFLVLGFGIITLFPAAFALQRVLPDAISQDRPPLLRRYFKEFGWAMRRFWLSGFGLYAGGVMLAFGISFWAYSGGAARVFALAILIPLTGMILGLYLSGLAVLPDAPRHRDDEDALPVREPVPAPPTAPGCRRSRRTAHLVRARVPDPDAAAGRIRTGAGADGVLAVTGERSRKKFWRRVNLRPPGST